MYRMSRFIAPLLLLGVLACASDAPMDEEERVQARAASVLTAMEAFDPAVFDTIAWASDEAAAERGSVVYEISCAKCHGYDGRGETGFVFEGEMLMPPSLVRDPWPLAQSPLELRRYIFSGNVAGMPYWGLVGLKYRDIDAVAQYLVGPLRDAAATQ